MYERSGNVCMRVAVVWVYRASVWNVYGIPRNEYHTAFVRVSRLTALGPVRKMYLVFGQFIFYAYRDVPPAPSTGAA